MCVTERQLLRRATLLLLFALACPFCPAQSLEEGFRPESVCRFADYLFRERDYLRAAEEYRRYLFIGFPGFEAGGIDSGDRRVGEVELRIGDCYQCAGLPYEALGHFERVLNGPYDHGLKREAVYEIAYCRTLLGDYTGAVETLRRAYPAAAPPRVAMLRAVNEMHLGSWEAARLTLESAGVEDPELRELSALAAKGAETRRKSPFLAGLLSTLLPGLGKMYAGELADGLFSTASIGLLAGLTVLGFRDGGVRSVRGWTYGSLAAVFYLGNIYGSAASAVRTNSRREEALLNDARRFLPPCWEE
jgi:tetratricopeptide (TPR) repeat protein